MNDRGSVVHGHRGRRSTYLRVPSRKWSDSLSISISLSQPSTGEIPDVNLLETKKGFRRRSIDQLGYIKDTNSLAVLSGVYRVSITPFL